MLVLHNILLIFGLILCVNSEINISEEEYNLLPLIFHIDPHEKCIQEKKIYCRVHMKLSPLSIENPSQIWNIIEKSKKSRRYYHHDELFHAVCINETQYKDINLRNYLSEIYNEKYKNNGLKVEITEVNCSQLQYHLNRFDIMLICLIFIYLLLTVVATCLHLKKKKETFPYLLFFSVCYNFAKLRKTVQQQKFQRLKCIQGIRFYTTVLIIFCHTFCSFAGGYVQDTKYLEDIPLNIIRHSIRNLFVFLVQTFFLISAWLLSYQTFSLFSNTKKWNLSKYICLTFINRYLRIIPPVLLMVSLDSSYWIHSMFSGPVKNVYSDKEYLNCQKNWWINFLFINNHYKQEDMCYFTTWYLAADTQLYTLSIFFLAIIVKFQHLRKLIMASSLLAGIIIPSVITYLYNLDIIYRITPENSKNNKFLTFEFSATYSSTYSNMATYMLGLIFGYIYFHYGNKLSLINNTLNSFFWWILSIGLPLIVVSVASHEYNRLVSALLAGILKPLYAMGIGIAIFGMSLQTNSILKKICEWKPVLFLANFTYTTYVVHFAIVFYRTGTASTPIPVSDYILFKAFLQDTILSFCCGFVLHLLLEIPLSHFRQLFIAQLKVLNKIS